MRRKACGMALIAGLLAFAAVEMATNPAIGQVCTEGLDCPNDLQIEKSILMRLGCQALEELEGEILPLSLRNEDPVAAWEQLKVVQQENIALIREVKRLKGCVKR